MNSKVTIISTEHDKHTYPQISELLNYIKPDCITIEQRFRGAGFLALEFLWDLNKQIAAHQKGWKSIGEYAAGAHYAIQNNTPIFCIDEYTPFKEAINTNLIEGENAKGLFSKTMEIPIKSNLSEYESLTTRNMQYLSRGINLKLDEGFQNIVHIGGLAHVDINRCVALQTLIHPTQIELIDAVRQISKLYK